MARIYFRDFWNLLHGDFEIYRILKDGIEEIPMYEEALECFVNANWLFIWK